MPLWVKIAGMPGMPGMTDGAPGSKSKTPRSINKIRNRPEIRSINLSMSTATGKRVSMNTPAGGGGGGFFSRI